MRNRDFDRLKGLPAFSYRRTSTKEQGKQTSLAEQKQENENIISELGLNLQKDYAEKCRQKLLFVRHQQEGQQIRL